MTEAEVRQALNGRPAQVLRSIWDDAWKQYVADGKPRHYRARASVMWDNAVRLADENLVPLPGVTRGGGDDMPVYVFDEAVVIHLKKTDRRLRTSGGPTKARLRRLITGTFDGMPDMMHITCGYTLDRAEAGIEFYPVVRTVRSRPEWNFDLRDICEPGEGLLPATPILPFNPKLPSLPTIRPAAKDESERE